MLKKLWFQVILGMISGLILGLILSPSAFAMVDEKLSFMLAPWIALVGNIFLALIKMIVIPLVVSSIILGVMSAKNIETLKLYSMFNPGYSLGQIGELAISKFFHSFKGADLNGVICSELSADSLEDHKPCFVFNVAPHCTVPVHIQLLDPKYKGEF